MPPKPEPVPAPLSKLKRPSNFLERPLNVSSKQVSFSENLQVQHEIRSPEASFALKERDELE